MKLIINNKLIRDANKNDQYFDLLILFLNKYIYQWFCFFLSFTWIKVSLIIQDRRHMLGAKNVSVVYDFYIYNSP